MELDAIRFCVGPWKSRYSSIWRIWSNKGDDNIYLGVSVLLNRLKISLHKSGIFRIAFDEAYNEDLILEGKKSTDDRTIAKWDKGTVEENEILQALDIHFSIDALSLDKLPDIKKNRKRFILTPDKDSLGTNDTITLKILFHKNHPEHTSITRAFKKRGVMQFFLERAIKRRVCIDSI